MMVEEEDDFRLVLSSSEEDKDDSDKVAVDPLYSLVLHPEIIEESIKFFVPDTED